MKNPYIYSEPLRGAESFYNRTSEGMRITSRIAADRPQSVSIVGGPRSGKTSIVSYLCDPEIQAQYLDDPQQYTYLSLDLQKYKPQTPSAFFACLAAACDGYPMQADYDGFNELIKRLMGEGRKLVIFLDDFGVITQHSGFPLEFFSFMRSVANSNDVGYITTSPVQLQKLCHTQDIEESPFFNIFTTVTLESFKEADARLLVEDPAIRAGHPLGERADWVIELGGRSPYLLQLTAHLVFAECDNARFNREALASVAAKEARPYLEQVWQHYCTEAEREVLRSACTHKTIARRHEHAAASLERRGELCKNGDNYRITSGLLAHFVEEGGGFWKRLFA